MCKLGNSPSTSFDTEVIIRHFELKDLERVKSIFRDGMITLVPEMVKVLMKHRLTTRSPLHPAVTSAAILLTAVIGKWIDSSHGIAKLIGAYVASFVATTVAWFALYAIVSRKGFEGYIQNSLETDLADIQTVYHRKGGVFLVAVTQNDDKVVGMVGGEYKESSTKGNVYELRRMSVDSSMRGQGIGRKLLHALEEELKNTAKIFLTCSNLQYAAHKMYRKHGFELVDCQTYQNWPEGFEIWHFEKPATK